MHTQYVHVCMHACLLHRFCVCVSLLWLAFEVLDGRLMAVQEQDIIVPLDVRSEVAAYSHGMTVRRPITTARVLDVFKLYCAPPLPPKYRDVVVTHTPFCSQRSQLPEWRRRMVEPVPKMSRSAPGFSSACRISRQIPSRLRAGNDFAERSKSVCILDYAE